MRILHLIHSADPIGGGPIEGLKLLNQIHLQQGLDVELLCLDSPNAPSVQHLPFKVHALGPVRSKYGFTTTLAPWLHAHGIDYDALIIHGLWQFPGF